jgi:hypothetical protein
LIGVAGQRRAGEERPGPPEDRQDRRGVAGQARRAVDAVPVAGAHRADAPGAGSGPGPVRPGRGPHPGQAADREAARGRPDQDLVGAHRRARRVRPGDDRGADRRAAQPEGARGAGPGSRPHPAGRSGAGPARPVHRSPRPLARLLLGQLDELSARIGEVTTLLDAAINVLPTPTPGARTAASTSNDPADRTDSPSTTQPPPVAYTSAITRLCAVPAAARTPSAP